MKIDLWFPTATMQHQVSQEVNDVTYDKVTSWKNSDDYKEIVEYSFNENLNTSYHKSPDIIQRLNLKELKEEILNCAVFYAENFGTFIQKENITIDSWINFFEPGQYEAAHEHFGNYISGCYYVTAPEKSGNYEFYDPSKHKTFWNGMYNKNSNFLSQKSSYYVAEKGKLLMFPSYMEHSVLRNASNGVRISIAFNINVKNV